VAFSRSAGFAAVGGCAGPGGSRGCRVRRRGLGHARPQPVRGAPAARRGHEKKDKAASQYFYALTLKDSIEAWQAVVDGFPAPADRLYTDYAKQQLATLFLAKRRFDEAQAIFDDFAIQSDPHFKAFGLAGQAILLNLKGEYNQSQRVLDRLQSPVKPSAGEVAANGANGAEPREAARKPTVLFDLLDDKMRQAVTETIHRNVEKLNKQMSQEWDDIFKRHEPADAAPAGATDGGKQ
jgi:hypothetical protein